MEDKVEVSESGGKISIQGRLIFTTVPPLAPLAKSWVGSPGDVLEVDLAGVSHADSAGVALLLEWWSVAQSADRRLRYTNVSEQVERFIRINGLDATLLG